jgi:hypothetical protein
MCANSAVAIPQVDDAMKRSRVLGERCARPVAAGPQLRGSAGKRKPRASHRTDSLTLLTCVVGVFTLSPRDGFLLPGLVVSGRGSWAVTRVGDDPVVDRAGLAHVSHRSQHRRFRQYLYQGDHDRLPWCMGPHRTDSLC